MQTRVKTTQEIANMLESGRMLATVLQLLKNAATSGMSTRDLAERAKKELRALGGQPAFLGYFGFPDVICISLNDEIVHGIPRPDRIIQEGDVIGLDFGVTYKGMITDAAISTIIGQAPANVQDLVNTTEASLNAGINVIKAGVHIGDISAAIQAVLEKGGYGIIRDLVGHGVGHELHEEPNIANYGHRGSGPILKSGMTVAVEPMATLGGYDVKTDSDKWTIRTADGSLSAHFEHTILVTDNGAEILTQL